MDLAVRVEVSENCHLNFEERMDRAVRVEVFESCHLNFEERMDLAVRVEVFECCYQSLSFPPKTRENAEYWSFWRIYKTT